MNVNPKEVSESPWGFSKELVTIAHLEKLSVNFSSSSFVIRPIVLHPQSSPFLYD